MHLGEQREPTGDSGPEPGPALPIDDDLLDTVDVERPEHRVERVGIGEHPAHGENDGHHHGDDADEGDARAVKLFAETEDNGERQGHRHRRHQPNGPAVVSEDPRGDGDQPGDQRWVLRVAESEVSRPLPVHQLVAGQRDEHSVHPAAYEPQR